MEVLMTIYGMLISALLFYNKIKRDLEEYGFRFNVYDSWVANRVVNSKQHTIRFHIDNLMSSHVDKKVNDEFLLWLNEKYGKIGEVTANRGDKHNYLGMTIKFKDGEVIINMKDYVKNMLGDFPIKFKGTKRIVIPACMDIFSKSLSK